MRKHGSTPSRLDKHDTLAAISPPGVARGRFVGGQQSGLAGCKPPPLFTRGASSCSSQGRRQGEPWGASPQPSAPTYLPSAEIFRCILMFGEKRHQQAIILDGSSLRLGHRSFLLATRRLGIWQGCPSPKLINVYQCQHAYHDPQAGSISCHGGCLTGICLSLTATKSAVKVIAVIDCLVPLTSPSRSEK